MLLALIVFLPFLWAVLAWWTGRRLEQLRDAVVILGEAAEFLLVVLLARRFAGGEAFSLCLSPVLAGSLSFTADGFRVVYAAIAAFMWLFTGLFSPEYFRAERENLNRYCFFMLLTLGATEGVMLSADLMTAFVFFEILSFTSFTWVIHEETAEAIRAAYTYLFVAVIGGLVLFLGLVFVWQERGTLVFAQLAEGTAAASPRLMAGGICILLGFGAKAGMFPLHVWLPKAHPVAPSPASALLSGILTKVGVYGILMTVMSLFAKDSAFGLLVLTLGVITMALGAVLALLSVNLKRTLACSSMSQIGFILTGIGMAAISGAAGNEEGIALALGGAMLHMVNHSLIKLTLFMAAGVVVMNLHTLTLDDIRGYGRGKWGLMLAFALGALGISGVPFFNGYLSKTLLHEAIVANIHGGLYAPLLRVIEWVFLASGGFTFAYMLKLFICLFVEKNRDGARQAEYEGNRRCMNALSTAVIAGSSLLMPLLGQRGAAIPLGIAMSGEELLAHFAPFTWENLKGGFISLGIGLVVYLLAVRHLLYRDGSYVDRLNPRIDLEELVYRPLLTRILPRGLGAVAVLFGENRVLAPLCRIGFLAVQALAKIICSGTDWLVAGLRRTVLKERRVRGQAGFFRKVLVLGEEAREELEPTLRNFSFALLMTCIGILLILVTLIVCLLAD